MNKFVSRPIVSICIGISFRRKVPWSNLLHSNVMSLPSQRFNNIFFFCLIEYESVIITHLLSHDFICFSPVAKLYHITDLVCAVIECLEMFFPRCCETLHMPSHDHFSYIHIHSQYNNYFDAYFIDSTLIWPINDKVAI